MDIQKMELLGAAALVAIIIGITGWYIATHPAPVEKDTATGIFPTEPFVPGGEAERIVESEQYYDIEAELPGAIGFPLSSNSEADENAKALMENWVLETIATFKEEGNFDEITPEDAAMFGYDQGRKQLLAITYEVRSSPKTVSYLYTIVQDTLGAHPNSFYRTFTFATATGKPLALADLFLPNTRYLERLSTESRERLPGIIGEFADIEYIESGTEPLEISFQSFVVDGSNLVLLFPPYQVGPYALGPVALPIPLTELSDIADPFYLP